MRDFQHGFAGCIEDGRKSRPRRSNLHGVNDKTFFGQRLQRAGVIAVVHPTLDGFNIARYATDCCETLFFDNVHRRSHRSDVAFVQYEKCTDDSVATLTTLAFGCVVQTKYCRGCPTSHNSTAGVKAVFECRETKCGAAFKRGKWVALEPYASDDTKSSFATNEDLIEVWPACATRRATSFDDLAIGKHNFECDHHVFDLAVSR